MHFFHLFFVMLSTISSCALCILLISAWLFVCWGWMILVTHHALIPSTQIWLMRAHHTPYHTISTFDTVQRKSSLNMSSIITNRPKTSVKTSYTLPALTMILLLFVLTMATCPVYGFLPPITPMQRVSSLYSTADLESEVQSMRAGAIKQELESYGISTKSFLEKVRVLKVFG